MFWPQAFLSPEQPRFLALYPSLSLLLLTCFYQNSHAFLAPPFPGTDGSAMKSKTPLTRSFRAKSSMVFCDKPIKPIFRRPPTGPPAAGAGKPLAADRSAGCREAPRRGRETAEQRQVRRLRRIKNFLGADKPTGTGKSGSGGDEAPQEKFFYFLKDIRGCGKRLVL